MVLPITNALQNLIHMHLKIPGFPADQMLLEQHGLQFIRDLLRHGGRGGLRLRPGGGLRREGDPAAVMTSYNLVNGVHTSQHRGLIEDILRREFGFDGIVMTDWVTGGSVLSKNAKHPVPHAGEVAEAGGDLFMPGSKKEIREITDALRDGRLTERQLRINASRVIRAVRRLCEGGNIHAL